MHERHYDWSRMRTLVQSAFFFFFSSHEITRNPQSVGDAENTQESESFGRSTSWNREQAG